MKISICFLLILFVWRITFFAIKSYSDEEWTLSQDTAFKGKRRQSWSGCNAGVRLNRVFYFKIQYSSASTALTSSVKQSFRNTNHHNSRVPTVTHASSTENSIVAPGTVPSMPGSPAPYEPSWKSSSATNRDQHAPPASPVRNAIWNWRFWPIGRFASDKSELEFAWKCICFLKHDFQNGKKIWK